MSRIAPLVMMAWLALAAGAPAQAPAEMEARRFFATRAELSSLLEQLPPTSIAAQVARQRLAEGDLQIGDGVLLAVEGEPLLSDTFVVSSARELTLPMVGQVPVRGVLYVEMEPYLTTAIGRQLRDPVVRARGFVRLLVTGGVARPGVYLVPADALLSDAVMAAGGLTADSRMSDMTAQRAGVPVIAGREMKAALAEGRTLAQVNLRSGDELMLPMNKSNTDAFNRVRMVGILLSIPLTIYSLTRIF